VTWESPLRQDGTKRGDTKPATARVIGFDPSQPHPARVYQAWLGGKDTFGPDRDVAAKVAEIAPWVVAGARGNRAFLTRVITFLAKAGISQFLDVGSGLPAAGNVHEIAQAINPDARVVYVDHDEIVLVHARALLACDERTIAVAGDARKPESILANPDVRGHLDFSQPIAVLFIAVLHFLREDDDPAGVVAAFRDALAPGSHVVISHVAAIPDDGAGPARAAATREAVGVYEELAAPFALRTPEQITALFTGLHLVDPGVVPVHLWKPARGRPGPAVPVLGGVGYLGAPVPGTAQTARPAGGPRETHAAGSGTGIPVSDGPVSASPPDPDLDVRPDSLPLLAPERGPRRSPGHDRLPDHLGGQS
jgi:SAM-dependent methyltransferase